MQRFFSFCLVGLPALPETSFVWKMKRNLNKNLPSRPFQHNFSHFANRKSHIFSFCLFFYPLVCWWYLFFEGNFSFSNKKLSGIPFVHLRWFNAQQKSNETKKKKRGKLFFPFHMSFGRNGNCGNVYDHRMFWEFRRKISFWLNKILEFLKIEASVEAERMFWRLSDCKSFWKIFHLFLSPPSLAWNLFSFLI